MTERPVHERIAEDRAHYLAHPDEDEWEEVPPPTGTVVKRPATMVSVRLTAAEADAIRTAAEAQNQSVSGFMRKAVLDRIQASRATLMVVTARLENSSRTVGQVEFEPGVPLSGGVPSNSAATGLTGLVARDAKSA
jgi:hypothetical protein